MSIVLETAMAVDRKVLHMHYDRLTTTKVWYKIVLGFFVLAALFAILAIVTLGNPAKAFAQPGDEMKLGEFNTAENIMVQTGCVSPYPGKPNYIEFSTFYLGSEDAALQLEHAVNGQWVTPSSNDLRITVGLDQQDQRQSFALLAGGLGQRFDITVWHVQPDEQWRLVGRHLPNGSTTLLAAWTAAERNECMRPIEA